MRPDGRLLRHPTISIAATIEAGPNGRLARDYQGHR
jgi:hypothetical protein